MGERFERAKLLLKKHEQFVQADRQQQKRLGKTLPDERIKIPKIGEWALSQQTYEDEIENESN